MRTIRPGLRCRPTRTVAAAAILAASVACGPGPPEPASAGANAREARSQPVAAARPKVVFLGDSLTAGYGLDAGDAYPSILQRRLRDAGLDAEVVNAGVSGDTSAGGLRRLGWALDGHVIVIVVALGGNDALRGLGTDDLRRNLSAIVEGAQQRNVTVILAGMEAPPNLGASYTSAFRRVYRDIASSYRIALIPFLLEGVAGDAALNQADLIHPNAEGARRVADHVWPYVERAVRAAGKHD